MRFAQNILDRLAGANEIWQGGGDDILALIEADGRFQRVSEAVQRITGYSHTKLKGESLIELIVPEDRAVVLENLHSACINRNSTRCECRLLRADGKMTWIEFTAAPTSKGNVRAVLRDISAKQLQIMRQRAALVAAETMAAQRSNYFADINHEIRTPLNAIIGFADLMRSETFGPLGHKKYTEYAQLVHQSGQHLHSLVTDLLDLSKLDADKYQLIEEPILLDELLRDCVGMNRLEAEKAGLILKLDMQTMPFSIMGDGRAIRQMVLNLLSNAIKFTKKGSITVKLRHDTDYLWISIVDTGIGMSEQMLAEAKNRYSGAHRPGVRGAAGTGLGLALTAALAKLHQGELRMTSEEGQGTQACLELPLRIADSADNMPQSSEPLHKVV